MAKYRVVFRQIEWLGVDVEAADEDEAYDLARDALGNGEEESIDLDVQLQGIEKKDEKND